MSNPDHPEPLPIEQRHRDAAAEIPHSTIDETSLAYECRMLKALPAIFAKFERDLAPSQPQHPASEDALREALEHAREYLLDGGPGTVTLAIDAISKALAALSRPQPAEPDTALALQKYEAGPSILSNAIRTYNLARNAGSSQHESMDAAIRQVLGAVGSDAAVARLVIAARIVAFEDQSPEALRELDKATEPFASIVPWDNEPEQGASDHGR